MALRVKRARLEHRPDLLEEHRISHNRPRPPLLRRPRRPACLPSLCVHRRPWHAPHRTHHCHRIPPSCAGTHQPRDFFNFPSSSPYPLFSRSSSASSSFIVSSPTFACVWHNARSSGSPDRRLNPTIPASRKSSRHVSISCTETWISRLTSSTLSPRKSRSTISLLALALHRSASAFSTSRSRPRGIYVGKNRVLRLMREHRLLAPHRRRHAHGDRAHAGTIITARPDELWGTDATKFWTQQEGWCWFFGAIDHCSDDIVGWHVAKRGDRWGGVGADSAGSAADAWRLRAEDRPGFGPPHGLGPPVHGASVSRGAALARDPAVAELCGRARVQRDHGAVDPDAEGGVLIPARLPDARGSATSVLLCDYRAVAPRTRRSCPTEC